MHSENPVFVIAEAGVNHNGDPALAADLVVAAKAAGADAVKFQTFDPDALVSAGAETAAYQKQATGNDDQQDMLRGLVLDDAAHRALFQQCSDLGIEFISTPFDAGSAEMLVALGVQRLKVGSGDVTNIPLLRRIAEFDLPVILSTGMADMAEIDRALQALSSLGKRLSLLHCVSAYPTPMQDANLNAIRTLDACYGLTVGYSDHTLGISAAPAAVALGARIIEKHLTLDRTMPGPDHSASLEPEDFAEMVTAIRDVAIALGDGVKVPRGSELDTRRVARRGLKAATDLAAGAILRLQDIAVLRPETGIAPHLIDDLPGRTLRRSLTRGAPILPEDLA
ncbi:MAG: N-acetylneuraminate synthase [Minwuia sp.]|nr:N-acetylneuraminate synthase [Minwuia sp.]